jgi:5,10-methylenetetrahydrofolate reductase
MNGGVPAIHFYTMNQSAATLAIVSSLKRAD